MTSEQKELGLILGYLMRDLGQEDLKRAFAREVVELPPAQIRNRIRRLGLEPNEVQLQMIEKNLNSMAKKRRVDIVSNAILLFFYLMFISGMVVVLWPLLAEMFYPFL